MKSIIKILDRLMIPIIILAGCSMLFERELKDVPYIIYIRYVLLILLIIGVISGILEYLEKRRRKK